MEQKHGVSRIMDKYISNQVEESISIKQKILENKEILDIIKIVSQKTIDIYKNGNKTLIAGNGGSAADAQHIAGEFVSKFYFDRPGLASIALTTDTSILTAIGNDHGYEKIFSRQIQANGVEGDIFIGISTSGNSKNIIEALKECKRKGIITVGLTGESGGLMNELCDFCIKVPSPETPRVQEVHILIGHIICAVVEEELFGKGFN
jgi:D-sedoheptulose 7-phosphate isomerase